MYMQIHKIMCSFKKCACTCMCLCKSLEGNTSKCSWWLTLWDYLSFKLVVPLKISHNVLLLLPEKKNVFQKTKAENSLKIYL